MVRNSLQRFDAEETYVDPRNRSVSLQKRGIMFCFHHFEYSHDAVSKMCLLMFRFQNLPFSKSAGTKFAVFVWFRVNGRPIRHIFHHFQNVPASYERSLNC